MILVFSSVLLMEPGQYRYYIFIQIFAGLAALFPETTGSRMILSAMPQDLVESVFNLVDALVGAQEESHVIICFTLPIEEFRGIRKQ